MAIPKNDVEVIEELKRLVRANLAISTKMHELEKDRRYSANDQGICKSLAEVSDEWVKTLSDIVAGVGTIAMYRKDANIEDIVKALAK